MPEVNEKIYFLYPDNREHKFDDHQGNLRCTRRVKHKTDRDRYAYLGGVWINHKIANANAIVQDIINRGECLAVFRCNYHDVWHRLDALGWRDVTKEEGDELVNELRG